MGMIFGCVFTGDNLLDSNGDNPLSLLGTIFQSLLGMILQISLRKLFQTAFGKISDSTGDILYSAREYSYTPLGNIKTFRC